MTNIENPNFTLGSGFFVSFFSAMTMLSLVVHFFSQSSKYGALLYGSVTVFLPVITLILLIWAAKFSPFRNYLGDQTQARRGVIGLILGNLWVLVFYLGLLAVLGESFQSTQQTSIYDVAAWVADINKMASKIYVVLFVTMMAFIISEVLGKLDAAATRFEDLQGFAEDLRGALTEVKSLQEISGEIRRSLELYEGVTRIVNNQRISKHLRYVLDRLKIHSDNVLNTYLDKIYLENDKNIPAVLPLLQAKAMNTYLKNELESFSGEENVLNTSFSNYAAQCDNLIQSLAQEKNRLTRLDGDVDYLILTHFNGEPTKYFGSGVDGGSQNNSKKWNRFIDRLFREFSKQDENEHILNLIRIFSVTSNFSDTKSVLHNNYYAINDCPKCNESPHKTLVAEEKGTYTYVSKSDENITQLEALKRIQSEKKGLHIFQPSTIEDSSAIDFFVVLSKKKTNLASDWFSEVQTLSEDDIVVKIREDTIFALYIDPMINKNMNYADLNANYPIALSIYDEGPQSKNSPAFDRIVKDHVAALIKKAELDPIGENI